MNSEIFINEILEKYKNMNITNFKYTIGSNGLHIDFKYINSDIIQYDFIKFGD